MSQIISFLQQNAHPRVAERIPSIPENVTDQVLDLNIVIVRVCVLLFPFSDT